MITLQILNLTPKQKTYIVIPHIFKSQLKASCYEISFESLLYLLYFQHNFSLTIPKDSFV